MKFGFTIVLGLLFNLNIFAQSGTNFSGSPPSAEESVTEYPEKQIDSLFKVKNYDYAAVQAEQVLNQKQAEFGLLSEEYENCLIRFGQLFYKRNNRKSSEFFNSALTCISQRSGQNNLQYMRVSKSLGNVLTGNKQPNEALKHSLKALEICENLLGKSNLTYAHILSDIGLIYKRKGDYKKSLPHYLEALEINKKLPDKDEKLYGAQLAGLAKLYETLGDYEKALPLYLESNIITEKYQEDDPFKYALSFNSLAQLYKKRLEYEKAIPLYEKALDIIKKNYGINTGKYTYRLTNLSNLYRKKGDFEKALSVISKAQNIPDNKKSYIYYQYWGELASLKLEIGDCEEALRIALNVLESVSLIHGENHIKYGTFINLIAKAYECIGETDESIRMWAELSENTEQKIVQQFHHFSEYEQSKWLKILKSNLDNILSFNYRHPENPPLNGINYNQNILLKGLLMNNYQRMTEAFRENSEYSQYLLDFEEWEQLKKQLAKQYAMPSGKRSVDFDSLVLQLNHLESALARASVDFKQNLDKTGWEDIQSQLKHDEAAIEFTHFSYYLPGSLRPSDSLFYVTYLIKKDNQSPIMIPLFEDKELPNPNAILRLYKTQSRGKRRNLNRLIWQPLQPYLKNVTTIYFSPSGKLNRINFGAIPINETETISDRFEIHQLGSTRQLILRESNQNESPVLADAVLFGGIEYQFNNPITDDDEFDSSNEMIASRSLGDAYRKLRGNEWTYLEWTEKEVSEIGDLLKSSDTETDILNRQIATEESFKNLGKGEKSPQIIHLATHGYFFPAPDENPPAPNTDSQSDGFIYSEHPMIRSGLILAGANRVWKGGNPIPGKEDGILTAYEIAQLDLRNTELVVLSACNTALGDIQGNEGVYGLQRAFKLAGVKYILMSLWSVPDKQTHEFMTAFYREYLDGKTIPEAYRITQNFMREKYSEPFDPSVWAGFVLAE